MWGCMNREILRVGVLFILFSLLVSFAPSIMAAQSSNGAFNVTPSFIYINWTSGTINVTSNSDNLTVIVDNSSTQIFSNYSQFDRYLIGDYENLTGAAWNLCFNSTPGANPNMKFRVQNETGSFTTTSKTLNQTNSTLFYIIPYVFCPPGKYYGYFYVKNETNHTENLTVNVSVHIPISEQNTFNRTTNRGFFRGATVLNYGYYHSYYFNTSLGENATALTVTLGSSSYDMDIFLYDSSGNLLAKSINSTSLEEIVHNLPTTPGMYEIRVYGNVSANYNGYLYFSTLNITNTTGSKITSIDFGELDANGTSNRAFILKNEDDQVLTSVKERKVIYLSLIHI